MVQGCIRGRWTAAGNSRRYVEFAASWVTMAKCQALSFHQNHAGCGGGPMLDIARRWRGSSASWSVDQKHCPTRRLDIRVMA